LYKNETVAQTLLSVLLGFFSASQPLVNGL
jgi:hypothetical protein